MSDIAKLGFSVDTTGLKKGEKALTDFAKTGEKTEKRTDASSKKIIDDMQGVEKAVGKSAAAQLKADKAMAQFSRRSGQAGIQFQQFIGQVQGGQGVMLALSQQSADLGFVLGAPLLGAIAGISASLVGLLIPNLIDTTSAMEDLDKAMETVNKTATDTDGIKAFTKEIALIAEESEKAGRLMILAAKQSATEAGRAAAEGISEEFNDAFDVTMFQGSFDALKSIAGTAGGTGYTISQEYKDLGEQFGLTGTEAREAGVSILVSLREMENAVSANAPEAGAKIVAFQEKLSDLAETAAGEKKAKLLTFVNSISEYVAKAKLATEMAALFDSTLKKTDLDLVTEETIKLDAAVEGVAQSLEAQIIALRDGEEAALNWSIAQRLGLKSAEDIPEAIKLQIAELKKLKKENEEIDELYKEIAKDEQDAASQKKKDQADAERDFAALTKKVENFGGAWTKTGSIIVDTFGDISDSISDYIKEIESLSKMQSSINEEREKEGADIVALNILQEKVNEGRVMAELDGIKTLSKAGKSLFDEKTAAAKAFAAVEQAMAAAQIAMTLEKIISSNLETSVVVTNEGIKQAALATTAVVNQGSGDPYTAFARIAAMTALMASLVSSFSGGGGGSVDMTEQRQETQGTGSVLGSDDKSQSILESQERFEDLQVDQLAELRGIRSSLNNVASGIALVTRDLIASQGLGEFSGDLSSSSAGQSSLGKFFSGEIFGLDFGGLGEKLISGIFGSTEKKIIDSGIQFVSQSLAEIMEDGVVQASQFFDIEKTKEKLFGLSTKVSTSTEFQALDGYFGEGIGAVFKNIGDVVLQSAEILGFDTITSITQSYAGFNIDDFNEEDFSRAGDFIRAGFESVITETEISLEEALSSFQVDIGQISLEGLSGEEIEAELQAVFSQQADLIAEYLVPSIADYQQVGEGLFDTLTRVAQEQVIFNDNIERMGFDLSDLSNVMQIDVAQGIIALTGGVENFADLSGTFFENFFSESEQFVFLQDSLTDVFDSLGLSLVESREEFKNLVEGIDLTTEEGQALLATLLEVNPALSEYIDELESIESKRVDMSIELLKLQGGAEKALAMERAIELEALDDSLKAMQLLIFAEEDRIALLEEQEDTIRSSFYMLEQAINLEKERAQASLDAASAAYDAEIDRLDNLRSELEAENTLRQGNLTAAEDALNEAFNSEMNLIKENASEKIALITEASNEEISIIKENADTRVASLNAEKSALEEAATSMASLISSVNSSLGLSGSSDLVSALASARKGDFTKAQALDLSSLTNLDSSSFSSAEEQAVQEALNRNRLKAISDLAGEQLTEAEAMIASIERQISATELASESELAAIEENTDEQIAAINEQTEAEILELENQLNALLGIDDSVLSIDEAIKQFQDAQKAVDELGYEQEVERLDMLVDSANDVYALHEQAYADEIERLDAILTDNEELLNAALGIDASVLSVADAITALNASISALGSSSGSEATSAVENSFAQVDDQYIPVAPASSLTNTDNSNQTLNESEIKEELRKTREDNVMFQRELIKNTNSTARILQRIEMDGLNTRPD